VRSHNYRCPLLFGLLLALVPFFASARQVLIYVTDSGGDRVHAINPVTDKVVQVIDGIEMPHGIGFAPDGSQIYISNESKNVLDIVDRISSKIVDEARLSGIPTISPSPRMAHACWWRSSREEAHSM
jgi:YVTN family beta-propeller protein